VHVAAWWESLGTLAPRALVDARQVLHHSVQLVAAVGRSLVPPRPDDGHTSLEWVAAAFVGQPVPATRPWVAALRPFEMSLLVVADGTEKARLSLAGRTRDEAFAWLADAAERVGTPKGRLALDAPYRIPEHAVGSGAPFPETTREIAELSRWFANGDSLLRAAAAKWPGAAPVRVWPHHFDVGSVLPLGAAHGEESPSIGIGLSSGDEGIAEPYFYATLWPTPDPQTLPPLQAGGRWNREGWTGAVLTATEVTAAGDGPSQAAVASAFLQGAIEALRGLYARRA
jgi:hypothetical protein